MRSATMLLTVKRLAQHRCVRGANPYDVPYDVDTGSVRGDLLVLALEHLCDSHWRSTSTGAPGSWTATRSCLLCTIKSASPESRRRQNCGLEQLPFNVIGYRAHGHPPILSGCVLAVPIGVPNPSQTQRLEARGATCCSGSWITAVIHDISRFTAAVSPGVGAEVEWRVNQRLGKRSPKRHRRKGTPSRPAKGWNPATKVNDS
jgi:hypothetical protein